MKQDSLSLGAMNLPSPRGRVAAATGAARPCAALRLPRPAAPVPRPPLLCASCLLPRRRLFVCLPAPCAASAVTAYCPARLLAPPPHLCPRLHCRPRLPHHVRVTCARVAVPAPSTPAGTSAAAITSELRSRSDTTGFAIRNADETIWDESSLGRV